MLHSTNLPIQSVLVLSICLQISGVGMGRGKREEPNMWQAQVCVNLGWGEFIVDEPVVQ